MTPTTEPIHVNGPTPKTTTAGFVSLRTASYFINLPERTRRSPELAYRALVTKGVQLIEAARQSLTSNVQLATVRLITTGLDSSLSQAKSHTEAEAISNEEFQLREDAGTELNRRAVDIFGTTIPPQVFIGGFSAAAHSLGAAAFQGFLNTAVRNLPSSRWQFGVAALGDATLGIHQPALNQTADAIAALREGGTRFAAMFGTADHTPFCPCAQQKGEIEGASIGMSSPAAIQTALRSRGASESAEDAARRAQHNILRTAEVVGRRIATKLHARFFGCDPSQAPVFDSESPGSNSIGGVIEAFSGVSLGLPGTKDGFFRLMDALRRAGSDSGTPLCGFLNGSFLPIAEDDVVAAAVAAGRLTYSGILNLCHVCAAGIDMAVVEPGTTGATIARVLRDVAVTHLLKGKALAARLIVPERGTPTDGNGYFVFGGLLGRAPVLPLDPESR